MKTCNMLLGAVLGVLAAGTAMAQSNVTVFGVIDATVASRETSGGARTAQVSDAGLSSSHFGFRGVEALGDGLTARFELSGFFTGDTGAIGRFSGDTMFSRSARIGLAGTWGALDFGRMSTPYFLSLIMFNPFGDAPLYSPVFLHTYTGGQFPISSPPLSGSPTTNGPDSGVSNAVRYTTPVVYGVMASIVYAPGETAGAAGRHRLIGNINYHGGALAGSFAFEHDRMAFANPNQYRQRSYMGSLAYDFGMLKLFAQLERTMQGSLLAGDDRHTATSQLGVSVPAGIGKILASWARSSINLPSNASPYTVVPGFPVPAAGTRVSGVDPRRDTVTVGYDYSLSTRSDVYTMVMVDRYTGLPSGRSVALGIRHRF